MLLDDKHVYLPTAAAGQLVTLCPVDLLLLWQDLTPLGSVHPHTKMHLTSVASPPYPQHWVSMQISSSSLERARIVSGGTIITKRPATQKLGSNPTRRRPRTTELRSRQDFKCTIPQHTHERGPVWNSFVADNIGNVCQTGKRDVNATFFLTGPSDALDKCRQTPEIVHGRVCAMSRGYFRLGDCG